MACHPAAGEQGGCMRPPRLGRADVSARSLHGRGYRNADLAQPGVLVPVAALQVDLAPDDPEEPAAAELVRLPGGLGRAQVAEERPAADPLPGGPLAVPHEILDARIGVGE